MKRNRLLWLVLAVALMVAGLLAYRAVRGTPVPVYVVAQAPLVQYVVATGRVSAVSNTQVGTEITGIVQAVQVSEGDHVQPGDTLLTLRSDDQAARVREAQAALDALTRSRLPQAEARLLGLVREELAAQEIPHCYLDGSLSPKARQAEVDRFQTDASVPVFLISLKAGGTGLNLTGADVVVHLDPWWNPAAEAQATDRAHRIGQTKVVTSYKLVATGTVEEKVLQLQETKRQLLADVFEASDSLNARLELADLRALVSP